MSQDAKRLAAEAQLSALPLPDGEASWARDARARARTRLLEAGAPARRDEYWKYTNPASLTAPLVLAADAADAPGAPEVFAGIAQRAARFVNGQFREDLSDELAMEGVAASSLADALAQDISITREIFGVLEAAGQDKVDRPLASLNTAVAQHGLVLQVTGKATDAIHIRYDSIGDGASLVHHVVRVESGASLTLLESGHATNAVMEIDIAEGGTLHHVRVQTEATEPCVSHIFARLAGEAEFKTFTLSSDGALTRNEVVMAIEGDEATGHIAGAVLAKGESHIDNTVFVTHDAVNCESRQVFKNVLAGSAQAIFQGKIYVKEGAQKTDGYQISQAVLLNDGAEFLAKPELEIYADDVACSHGSTTGALDRTAMFYLQSRGVPKAEAEAMLIAAFADEAIEEIANEALADEIRTEVARWMASRG